MWDSLVGLLGVLARDLTLDPALAARLAADPPRAEAWGVLALATASMLIGQGWVLWVNRVPPRRWPLAYLMMLLVVWLLKVVQALALWVVGWLVTAVWVPLGGIIVAGMLAMAPHVFNALTAAPHVGLALGRVLQIWEALVLFSLVLGLYGTTPGHAVVLVGVAWGATLLLAVVLARRFGHLVARLASAVSGRPVVFTMVNVLQGTPVVPTSALAPVEVQA